MDKEMWAALEDDGKKLRALTDDDLDELMRLREAGTQGEWAFRLHGGAPQFRVCGPDEVGQVWTEPDAAKIAAAVNNAPALIAEVRALRAEVEAVRELIETAQWARNRLEIIADECWHGDGRDLKRSVASVFADFDAALSRCGSFVPKEIRTHFLPHPAAPETPHD
jgi:hypothetical protein